MKKLIYLLFIFALLFNQISFCQVKDLQRDGRLLQGDNWIKFSYPESADFYVSPVENDSWSGLFVRNDISKSFDVKPVSKGSVLVFGTPGRAGIEYDEFANGCMHKASSQNLPENSKTPIFLKMVRHGNSFSGYISLDGKNWIIERHTKDIPGIAESVDIGLAAGGPDKQQYRVEFADWKIEIAKQ